MLFPGMASPLEALTVELVDEVVSWLDRAIHLLLKGQDN